MPAFAPEALRRGLAVARGEVVASGGGAEVVGVVIEQQPSSLYRVRLDEGGLVTAHLTSPANRNFVRILVGDRVRVELSAADVGRGRIVEKL